MRPTRRGVSLAELLVVMIACTALFSLTGELLCRVMRVQIESRGHADVERNALRLSRQFRSDVHQARVFDLADDDESLVRLELTDGKVAQYTVLDRTIRRQLLRDGEVAAVEVYQFPDPLQCEINELAEPARLQLSIAAKPYSLDPAEPATAVPSNPIHLRVEAVLGRDLRHNAAAASKEDSA